MGSTADVSGPDLRAGVPLGELKDREPLSGHVDGEAVVVVRLGEEVCAIGGTCTHYSAPLGQGMVTGDVIRCPWHHACFSLRTGEAVAAPALNPVAKWHTEVRDGVVRVTRKEEADALEARGGTSGGPSSVVIVGAGAAGSAAAEMLRREGYAGPITMIDPDAEAPYDRPNLSKDYLAGKAPEEWIPLRPAGFYEEHGISRVTASVTMLNAQAHTVTLSNGAALEYGALLLATGAAPIRLKIPGADAEHVHVLRSFADCRKLIEGVKTARKVVIAGASFIGMEAAASLRGRGLQVTVVAPEAVPFEKTLGAELGRALLALHEKKGVAFHLGRTLSAIGTDDVTLDDGTRVDADIVLLGVGVRPVLQVAEQAGLTTRNGVVVDAQMRSSVPDVYAAGDIVCYPDPNSGNEIRVEHWVVAQRQGQVAARNILGRPDAFTSIPFFWSAQFETTVAYVGHAGAWDATRVDGDPADDCRVEYLAGDRVAAVATIGRDSESLAAEVALEQAQAPRGKLKPFQRSSE